MNRILCLVVALAAVVSSCTKVAETTQKEKNAVLRVTLAQTKAVGTPTQDEENTITTFTVYVFEDDLLERVQTFPDGLTGEVTGLTAGLKDVVVVANPTATFPTFAIGTSIDDFALAANYIDLDDQADVDLDDTGLMMTGQGTITLAGLPATNALPITLERIVAKVMLGTFAVATADANLVITGVYITQARSLSSVGIPSIVTTPPYYGGVVGPLVTAANQRDYLFEPISEVDFANRYFYVFANDNSDLEPTIMGIAGEYLGVPTYFPFVINDAITGGTYIARNTQHIINITINRPAAGSADPETPSVPATLTVTVTPADWTLVPEQDLEW